MSLAPALVLRPGDRREDKSLTDHAGSRGALVGCNPKLVKLGAVGCIKPEVNSAGQVGRHQDGLASIVQGF